MPQPQRLIFEDADNSYEVFIDTAEPVQTIESDDTDTDFAIEVKCKFPKSKKPN